MIRSERSGLDRFLSSALALWGLVTVVFVLGTAAVYATGGREALGALVQKGPVSGLKVTYGSLAVVWLAWGLVLALLRHPGFRARYGILTVCSLVALLLYANVLRERPVYPDAADYIRAAFDLHEGRSFHPRYIYPPLLAALLEPLVPFGRGMLRIALWVSNLLAVPVLVGLLSLTLERYGFERRVSAPLVLAFAVVNTPLLRTLVYGQVNLHLVNLALLALLAYPRFPVGSALALALAVHLKASPLVLALPFLLEWNWRWTGAFVVWLGAMAGAIYAAHGVQPFLDYLGNASGLFEWTSVAFREASIGTFLRSTATVVGGPFAALGSPGVILALKAGALALALAVSGLAMWRGPFAPRGRPGSLVLNAWPALTVLMALASPLLWVHHGVFVALPFLVLTGRLRGAGEWAFFTLAYAFVFLLPTFDFYPWSFGRLGALFVVLALLYRTSGRTEAGDALEFLRRGKITASG